MPEKFAKLFEVEDLGQVLIRKDTVEFEGRDRPAIIVHCDTDFTVAGVDMKFQDDDNGWAARDRVFDQVDHDWARVRGSEILDIVRKLGL